MSQVPNLAFFRARRGQSEALGAALATLVEPARLEAGCLNYDLRRSPMMPMSGFVYENWRSSEGLGYDGIEQILLAHASAMAFSTPTVGQESGKHFCTILTFQADQTSNAMERLLKFVLGNP